MGRGMKFQSPATATVLCASGFTKENDCPDEWNVNKDFSNLKRTLKTVVAKFRRTADCIWLMYCKAASQMV